MKNWKVVVILVSLVMVFSMGVAAQSISVVTSTTWVGAMVRAAGIENVQVLAPIEMRHPAEYDFRPSDVILASSMDFVVWAGYEGFIPNLVEAAQIDSAKVLQVNTNNTPDLLREQVRKLATVFGTEQEFAKWDEKLSELGERLRKAAHEQGAAKMRVAVQAHQRMLVEWLGYNVVASFGPGELTPTQLVQILAEEPEMIIDNWHSAQGEPLRDANGKYASLLNFPGAYDTNSLFDVLIYNANQLGLEIDSQL